jgi:hypothetical protein
MTTIDPNAPILVTGATGYVAGWLVKALIDFAEFARILKRKFGNQYSLSERTLPSGCSGWLDRC